MFTAAGLRQPFDTLRRGQALAVTKPLPFDSGPQPTSWTLSIKEYQVEATVQIPELPLDAFALMLQVALGSAFFVN